MNLFHVLDVGSQSLSVMVFTLLTAFAVALGVGKFLKLDRDTTTLIGAGTVISGGSAITAVTPVGYADSPDNEADPDTILYFLLTFIDI